MLAVMVASARTSDVRSPATGRAYGHGGQWLHRPITPEAMTMPCHRHCLAREEAASIGSVTLGPGRRD